MGREELKVTGIGDGYKGECSAKHIKVGKGG